MWRKKIPKKRQEHSAQFKARIASEAAKEPETVNKLASEYQVHPTFVREWKKRQTPTPFDGYPKTTVALQPQGVQLIEAWGTPYAENGLTDRVPETEVKLVSYTNGGAGTEIMLPNCTDPNRETTDGERSSLQFPHPFLSDWNVRQAINLAIDREELQDICGFIGTPPERMEYTIIGDTVNRTARYSMRRRAVRSWSAGMSISRSPICLSLPLLHRLSQPNTPILKARWSVILL